MTFVLAFAKNNNIRGSIGEKVPFAELSVVEQKTFLG